MLKEIKKNSSSQLSASTKARAIAAGDLGTYLKLAREARGLSQGDVAHALKMNQSQSLSQWERNSSGSIPMPALRALIELYDLPVDEVYEVLLKFQTLRLESKLAKQFFSKPPSRSRKSHTG